MNKFRFPQRVMTPKGEAVFIGYFTDGVRAQVSRIAPAKEYTRAELEARKPSVAEMSEDEYKIYIANAYITVNEIYNADQLSPASDQMTRSRKVNKWEEDAVAANA